MVSARAMLWARAILIVMLVFAALWLLHERTYQADVTQCMHDNEYNRATCEQVINQRGRIIDTGT